jgi:signal peptidase II
MSGSMQSWVKKAALLAVVATTIGCDQVTKHAAATQLMGLPRQSYLGDTLRLEYAENPGAFLSLGASLPQWARVALFSVGTGLLLMLCGALALRRLWPTHALLAFSLVAAGGVSNLVDRLAHGKVIDFMNIGVGQVRTGIFNVADVAIMLGVALFLVHRRR